MGREQCRHAYRHQCPDEAQARGGTSPPAYRKADAECRQRRRDWIEAANRT